MKVTTLFLPFLMALNLMSASQTVWAINEGDMFPAVTIKDFDKSSQVSFDKGKVIVLNFWATWCEACKVELKEMQDEFKPLFAREDAVVRFVSLDKETDKAVQYIEEAFGKDSVFSKRLAFDPAFEAADKIGVDSFPMTIILDKAGKVVKIQRGFKEGSTSTKDLLKAAMAIK